MKNYEILLEALEAEKTNNNFGTIFIDNELKEVVILDISYLKKLGYSSNNYPDIVSYMASYTPYKASVIDNVGIQFIY